jgi:hypothetical protein
MSLQIACERCKEEEFEENLGVEAMVLSVDIELCLCRDCRRSWSDYYCNSPLVRELEQIEWLIERCEEMSIACNDWQYVRKGLDLIKARQEMENNFRKAAKRWIQYRQKKEP